MSSMTRKGKENYFSARLSLAHFRPKHYLILDGFQVGRSTLEGEVPPFR